MMLLVAFAAVAVQGPMAPQAPELRAAPSREWKVPWENTRPRDPFVAADGRVWFVGQQGHYIAVLDTVSGEFKRYELDPGTGPHNLVVGTDGMVYYAGNRASHIGKLDPATGKITKYMMPDSAVRDPHTLLLDREFDKNGFIWFTAQGANHVGKFESKTGKVHLMRNPTANGRPYGIIQSPVDGAVYYDEFNSNKIGRIDPATMTIREFVLPRAEARPRRIAVTDDGMIWYGDHAKGYLGRLDPATGAIKEWPNPSGERSRPYAMASDGKTVWQFETGVQPNKLVGFDPKTESFFSINEIPSGGGSVRHIYFDSRTRHLWFGTDVHTIGRSIIPEAPAPPRVS
jgi:virginiamycin B lyase